VEETFVMTDIRDFSWHIENLFEQEPDIQVVTLHEALYRLIITNESRDYETGHIDDYDHEFIKIKETS
jgi:hypothetical protein